MSDKVIAGRYEIISELGSGGNAFVYKVLDTTLQKVCALKTLKVTAPSANQIIRFQREARALSNLSHPNVITVFHFDVTESNQPYLVMEYLEGETLAKRIERSGPLPVEEALIVFTQICDGMAHTHAHKILHRDLATSNIMLVPIEHDGQAHDGPAVPFRVCIFDFGLAKIVADEGEQVATGSFGIAMGSPPYMSPEHSLGKNLTERSDIYSMGCIMYESLTGVPPILGDSPVETMSRQITEEAPALSAKSINDFPIALEKLVAKSLRKDPLRRFQSMDDLNAAIGVVWSNLNPGTPQPQTETLTVKKQPPRRRHTSHQPVTIVAVALVALLGGAVAWQIFREPERTPEEPLTVQPRATAVLDKERKKPPFVEESPVDEGRITLSGSTKGEGEQLLLQSFMADGSAALDWIPLPWEEGIIWSWKMASNSEVMALAVPLKSDYISVYNSGFLTPEALAHLGSLPVKGLGIGKLDLHTKELKLFLKAAPTLEVLYMEENRALKDSDLDLLQNFKKLKILSIGRCGFTDQGLAKLKGMNNLEFLKIDGMGTIGGGLASLQSLPKLTKLTLTGTHLSESGWKALGKLKRLKTLNLAQTEARDRDLEHLSLLNLEKVDISRNPVTPKCFKIFYPMKNLNHMRLHSCHNISLAAIATLKQDLPNCLVDQSRAESARKDPLVLSKNVGK